MENHFDSQHRKHESHVSAGLWRRKSNFSCSSSHGRRKDFIPGEGTRGLFQKFSKEGQKWWNLFFTTRNKKTTFFAEIFKIQRGQRPLLPPPSDDHDSGSINMGEDIFVAVLRRSSLRCKGFQRLRSTDVVQLTDASWLYLVVVGVGRRYTVQAGSLEMR